MRNTQTESTILKEQIKIGVTSSVTSRACVWGPECPFQGKSRRCDLRFLDMLSKPKAVTEEIGALS